VNNAAAVDIPQLNGCFTVARMKRSEIRGFSLLFPSESMSEMPYSERSFAMSSVSFIATTPPQPSVTAGKSTAPQAVAAGQAQSEANASSVTISSYATRRANYEQRMVERTAESN